MSDITERVDDRNRVRSWTAREFATLTGADRAKILRVVVPGLLAAGVIAKHGKTWFGKQLEIEQWLLGRWTPPAAAAPPPSRQTRSPARGKP